MEPVCLILDTDMDTDCDDAGALALVHNAVQKYECRLSAVICDVPYPEAAACVSLLNRYYSKDEIPVGIIDIPDHEVSPVYEKYRMLRENIPEYRRYNKLYVQNCKDPGCPDRCDPIKDSTEVYRKILSESADGSVVICAIGLLSALSKLLDSEPDLYSSMSGKELVAAKVKLLVTMAVLDYDRDLQEEFNWRMDIPAAQNVLDSWPAPIVLSSSGWTILTGEKLMTETDKDHPLNFIYRTYLKDTGTGRPSWDQLAVLYALGRTEFFNVKWGRSLRYDENGDVFRWFDDPAHRFGYAVPVPSDDHMRQVIEDMMISARATVQ